MNEEKKSSMFNTFAEDMGKIVKNAAESTKEAFSKAADLDHDGKVTGNDFSMMAESINASALKTASKLSDLVKDASTKLSQHLDENRRLADLKALAPLFLSDIQQEGFRLSTMIHITDMDQRRAGSDVCQGSIGYLSAQNELRIVNIFRKDLLSFPISLYPDDKSQLYLVDPVDPFQYIALNDYFEYLRRARVGELQRIAQDLGASHFRVTFKEQKKTLKSSSVDVDLDTNVKAKGLFGKKILGDGNFSNKHASKDYTTIAIAAESVFDGHDPIEPTLVYYKNDADIKTLIHMRMHENSVKHQTYMLSLSKTSCITSHLAMELDSAIRLLKLACNTTISHEVENEGRMVIEYEIDFQ